MRRSRQALVHGLAVERGRDQLLTNLSIQSYSPHPFEARIPLHLNIVRPAKDDTGYVARCSRRSPNLSLFCLGLLRDRTEMLHIPRGPIIRRS
jgi:hypothetical protein